MSIGVKSLQGPLKDEVANIYNLCPISCGVRQKQTNLSGWLRMDIKPAEESVKVAMLTLAASIIAVSLLLCSLRISSSP